MVLEARSSRSRCQQVWFLVSALIVVLDGYFLPRCPHDLLCPSGRAGDGGERGGGRRKERALSCKATGTVGLDGNVSSTWEGTNMGAEKGALFLQLSSHLGPISYLINIL